MAKQDGCELIDLGYLTENEKSQILAVIKRDTSLNRETLSSLGSAVSVGRKLQEEHSNKRTARGTCFGRYLIQGSCSCCGLDLSHDWTANLQCSQCKYLACKQCTRKGKKMDLCKICHTERYLDILSKDLSIKLSGNFSAPCTGSQISGSQLLQESLEVANQRPKITTTDDVTHSPGILKPNSKNSSNFLQVPGIGKRKKHVSLGDFRSQSVELDSGGKTRELKTNFITIKAAKSEADLAEISSLYSESCFDMDSQISGTIKLGVWYMSAEGILCVRIVSASGLVPMDGSSMNPYVKVHLLPVKGKQGKRRTGIQRRTNKPKYDEILKYKVNREYLARHTLWVSVWDWNALGKNKFLGEVRLPLSTMDLSNTATVNYTLKGYNEEAAPEKTDFLTPNGKLCIALKYIPVRSRSSTLPTNKPLSQISVTDLDYSRSSSLPYENMIYALGTLHVCVKRAEDLPSTEDANPFVRCYLLPNVKLGGRRKTTVVPKTLNPVWDEEFSYKMAYFKDLQTERALELTVWDMDRRGTNSFMGCVRLGPNPLNAGQAKEEDWMDASGKEVQHWEEMLVNPGEWVEHWHTLRPSTQSPRKDMQSVKRLSPEGSELSAFENSDYAEESDEEEADATNNYILGTDKQITEEQEREQKDPDSHTLDISVSRRRKGDHYEISGEIEIKFHYREAFYGRTLTVHVIKASGLAAVDKSTSSSNPYVKMYLLPNNRSKRRTKVKRKTLNPTFEQAFDFSISGIKKMKKSCLWITVWSHEKLQRNQFLGETWIRFDSYDLEKPVKEYCKLKLHDLFEA